MSQKNNDGMQVVKVAGDNGRTFLEVWKTDGTAKRTELVISCCVESFESDKTAVAGLLREFLHPFGAAWESPEQYGTELDAVKWLAAFYDVTEND